MSSGISAPAGTRCTWQGQWSLNTWQYLTASVVPTDAMSSASSYLETNAHMAVEASHVDKPGAAAIGGTYTVTLQVRTLIDRGDLDDIRADIEHAFFVSSLQALPDSSSVTNYTLPNSVTHPTGAPAANTAPDTPPGSSWWDTFIAQLEGGSVGFIVGAVAVVGLIIYISVTDKV